MNDKLLKWTPPTEDEQKAASEYCVARRLQNDLEITDLIAEHRDIAMRKQLSVSEKFMDRISEHVDAINEMGSKKEQRTTLRSLAETMKVVSDVQARAAMFDHVSKPKDDSSGSGRISLFVNCAPVGVANRDDAINVEAVEH